jgi:hypothetical protein
MQLFQMPNGGYRRYCLTCRREDAEEYVRVNRQVAAESREERRLARIVKRRMETQEKILDLIKNAEYLPDMVVFRTAGRLMRDLD